MELCVCMCVCLRYTWIYGLCYECVFACLILYWEAVMRAGAVNNKHFVVVAEN